MFYGAQKKLDQIRKLFSHTSIIVIRSDGDKLKMSKPCVQCLETIKKVGIKKIYYSTGQGDEIVMEYVKNIKSDKISQMTKFQCNAGHKI